ncbi:wall-associated receptor kinase galacturonan-binding protein [Tasmannia lanceolata]|uniref:wall-associated receptor kinase galacturonan-binding protein n=1 Tax=Tasmannia lanceolata TaxID=3420 RepID=UPI004063DC36
MTRILRRAIAILLIAIKSISANPTVHICRSYCGNLTIDYPFGIRTGCGHSGFRDLLFCINEVLMFHISSGSYRVLDIDYAYQELTLHDPDMSTCATLVRGKGNGFVLEPYRTPYLVPTPDNVFMLIGCGAKSPLFQGFPTKHLPCRNVSGMGCEEYYRCPAWDVWPKRDTGFGVGPPECCGVSFEAIRAINLSRLECEGYTSAYSLAPLHVSAPRGWMYGIRVSYSVPGDFSFCRACEATGGTCGYDDVAGGDLCMCGRWNSTSNCDSGRSMAASYRPTSSAIETMAGLFLASMAIL